jgi:hypothetical protein
MTLYFLLITDYWHFLFRIADDTKLDQEQLACPTFLKSTITKLKTFKKYWKSINHNTGRGAGASAVLGV